MVPLTLINHIGGIVMFKGLLTFVIIVMCIPFIATLTAMAGHFVIGLAALCMLVGVVALVYFNLIQPFISSKVNDDTKAFVRGAWKRLHKSLIDPLVQEGKDEDPQQEA